MADDIVLNSMSGGESVATDEVNDKHYQIIKLAYGADGTANVLDTKFTSIDAATSGDNTLVAAVTGKKIRVTSMFLVASAAVNVRFESGAGGTALTGQMNLIANTGFVLPFNPEGWFQTAVATLLNLELSGAVSVDGSLTYIEVA